MPGMFRRLATRTFVTLCVLLIFLPDFAGSATSPQSLTASPIDQYKPHGYVNDFAGMIDAKTQATLEEFCKQLYKGKQTELAIVTVVSLEGMPIKEFATQLYNRWGIGDKGTDRGVLILLSKNDHQYRIATGLGMESILTNEKCDRLGKEMLPLLRKGQYGDALLQLVNHLAAEIQPQVTTP
jgi:uncharacterized protein